MGLFDKKYCDVCGEKISLLGNKKLEDGNLCKDCAAKLSPWFSDRKRSTVEDIKAQLVYREENKAKVAAFHITKTLGKGTKVLLDEDAGLFMVTSASNLKDANPDVLALSDVTGCDVDVDESKRELKRRTPDGKEVSFVPARYEYSYTFYVTINVNNPYFNQIRFRLNSSSIDIETGAMRPGMVFSPMCSMEYQECQNLGNEIKRTLTQVQNKIRREAVAAAAPKKAVTCPYCGATTTPDASGCCEYCGGAVKG